MARQLLFVLFVTLAMASFVNAEAELYPVGEPVKAQGIDSDVTSESTEAMPVISDGTPNTLHAPPRRNYGGLIFLTIVVIATLIPWYMILKRMQFSKGPIILYLILLIIPLVNIIAIWSIAISYWPVLKKDKEEAKEAEEN